MRGAAAEILAPAGFGVNEFVENFELLSSVVGSTAALRELVQELAMRGRLVHQVPGDPLPGFALNALAEGELPDGPFRIPESWAWVRLPRVARFEIGRTPPTKSAVHWEDGERGFPWVSIGDMTNFGVVMTTARRVSDKAHAEVFRGRIVPKGTLLMSFKLTIGKVAILGCDAFHNEAIVSLFPETRETRDYLFRTLPLLTRLGTSKAAIKGATLNRESMDALLVPVPPLAEQKRIVAKVDQLMALCDELEARQTKKRETGTRLIKSALDALVTAEDPEAFDAAWTRVVENFDVLIDRSEKVAELRGSILELAVRGRLTGQRRGRPDAATPPADGRRFAVPKGWDWATMGETFQVAGGIQKTPARAPRNTHYPYLRVENVQRGRLDLDRIERFELGPGELARLRLEKGDLLVVEGNGSEKEIGRCAIWTGEINDCVHQNHIIRCRAVGGVDPAFALLFLNSPSGMAQMKALAITTSGLFSLSVGKIRGIGVPIPPASEQRRIVATVERLFLTCADLERQLGLAEARAGALTEAAVRQLVDD